MNTRLLRRVARHILEEPKRLVMHTIDTHGTPGTITGYGGKYPRCGTAACVCGWTCGLSKVPWNSAVYKSAATLLEITCNQALRLFEPSEWPEQFSAGLKDDGKLRTAKVAAARIEHFIKTKGRE